MKSHKVKCPYCGKRISVHRIASELAAKAGRAGKGKAKARSSEQMRAAVMVRWAKYKAKQKPSA